VKEIIAGAGGFLGSNLREHLESKEREVKVLSVEMLMDVGGMRQFFKDNEPYHFYYLAAYGNLRGQDDVQEIYRAVVFKLLNTLQATEGTDCRGIVVAGTTSEYGNKTTVMVEDMVLEPTGFYGAAKAGATHLVQAWARQRNAPAVVFRPASITGVGEQSIHLIPTLIRSCMLGEAMPFTPEAYHDYINVKDVCTALELLADKAQTRRGEIFNVGTGIQTSNEAVKEMVEHLTKQKANILTATRFNAQYASEVWTVNSDKMRALGWKPQFTLLETIREMVRAWPRTLC
jgi:nucleoside-diphosphate-sugar epimerase